MKKQDIDVGAIFETFDDKASIDDRLAALKDIASRLDGLTNVDISASYELAAYKYASILDELEDNKKSKAYAMAQEGCRECMQKAGYDPEEM